MANVFEHTVADSVERGRPSARQLRSFLNAVTVEVPAVPTNLPQSPLNRGRAYKPAIGEKASSPLSSSPPARSPALAQGDRQRSHGLLVLRQIGLYSV